MSRGPLWFVMLLALGSCTDSQIDRAVSIETSACGDASRTSGAGVIVGDGLVLASAHVVIGATDVSALIDGENVSATVVRLDARTDLALLRVGGVKAEPVELGWAGAGDTLEIVGGGASPPVMVDVARLVEIRIEEVRSPVRSSRSGYEIDHRVELGDSGAGAFDRSGKLVGVVFGRLKGDRDRSFIVDADEISLILSNAEDQVYACDPEQSKVVSQ